MSVEVDVRDAINQARARVYRVGKRTPLQRMHCDGAELWVKREDLGPVKAYKWRGAYNAMAALTKEERGKGVVAASAGNHAQGVALAAKSLGCQATIFMPVSTPQVKQDAVKIHGGDSVTIHLVGDSFSTTQEEALQYVQSSGGIFIPPYDSLAVIGGQGTLADEVVMSGEGPFDRVYVAIGGGGMAAAVSVWVKHFWPDCQVIGVEGEDQACMSAAFEAGEPVRLDYVDVFCDGTAVAQAGSLNYEICSKNLDGIRKVSNDEVSAAIKAHWDALRVVPEPSGAMSYAAFIKDMHAGEISEGEKVLTILCGANMDFAQLSYISRQAALSTGDAQSWRFDIPEKAGALAALLAGLPEGVTIYDVQYGRTDTDMQHPTLRLVPPQGEEDSFDSWLEQHAQGSVNVSDLPQARYRVIPYTPGLFVAPWFIEVEFAERAGALLAFMQELKDVASLCYFTYSYSGERVGRALLGLDFSSEAVRGQEMQRVLAMVGSHVRSIKTVPQDFML